MSAIYLGPSKSGRTRRFQITAEGGVALGEVKWYAPWRRFCFFATNDSCLFDAGCLSALSEFCASETRDQQERQKKRHAAYDSGAEKGET